MRLNISGLAAISRERGFIPLRPFDPGFGSSPDWRLTRRINWKRQTLVSRRPLKTPRPKKRVAQLPTVTRQGILPLGKHDDNLR